MEGAIKNGQSRDTGNIGHTRHKTKTKKKTKTQDRKLKRLATWTPRKIRGELAKGKQFLSLIRHPPCYSSI
jgi:hypothetical protein